MDRLGDEVEREEALLFVGREDEQQHFLRLLAEPNRVIRLINLSGTGGLGKSWLIRQYRRLAWQAQARCFMVDFRDFSPSPEGFELYLREVFAMGELSPDVWLNAQAAEGQVLLMVDSYERAAGFDRWFRETFLNRLNRSILLIIAGRNPLDGGWIHSTLWKRWIVHQPLQVFSAPEIQLFFKKNGVQNPSLSLQSAAWSGGLPLGLALSLPSDQYQVILPDIGGLSEHWMWETANEGLRRLTENAAMLRIFDQELLGWVLQAEVADAGFQDLIRLSFVYPGKKGWFMQEWVREAIQAAFRKSKPAAYQASRERCIRYYTKRLSLSNKGNQAQELQELLYHLSTSLIRAVLTPTAAPSDNYLEALNEENYPEVTAYLERRRTSPQHKINQFINYETADPYTLEMTEQQDYQRALMVDPADWLALGLESVKLLKNKAGRMLGLLAVIPIHRDTLHFLSSKPVTRTYFQMLSVSDRLALAVPPENPSGWYIRMLDVEDPNDEKARAELINAALGYISSGRIIVESTPVPFYQALLRGLGFEEAVNSTHYEYGLDYPAPTYVLDLRDANMEPYINRLMAINGYDLQSEPANSIAMTDRERDVARLLLRGDSNPEIAKALFLSEIAVKKHVSRLLQKAGCKNRGQLIKVLLDKKM